MNSTDPGGQGWCVVWPGVRTTGACSSQAQWASPALTKSLAVPEALTCFCPNLLLPNWFSLLWGVSFCFLQSPGEWECCFSVTRSFPLEYYAIEFTRWDVQVEGWVGLVAMEVSGKKNKWDESVSSAEVHESVCTYVCIGEGAILIMVTRIRSWQDRNVESVRSRWG